MKYRQLTLSNLFLSSRIWKWLEPPLSNSGKLLQSTLIILPTFIAKRITDLEVINAVIILVKQSKMKYRQLTLSNLFLSSIIWKWLDPPLSNSGKLLQSTLIILPTFIAKRITDLEVINAVIILVELNAVISAFDSKQDLNVELP